MPESLQELARTVPVLAGKLARMTQDRLARLLNPAAEEPALHDPPGGSGGA
ncbi:hypothetical protein [Paenarthrobacter sp. NCHU4564]|uniref:hypothetical protein n=1 Tax=Paenarthrobacter sp. NCHU4564 TaxID=3451353 RepID=UPI003F9488FA